MQKFGGLAAAVLTALGALAVPAIAGAYDSDAWGGKFRYGAYSTLISSHVLGHQFRHVIKTVSDPEADFPSIADAIAEFKGYYDDLGDKTIDRIIDFAAKDMTTSVYEEERSIVSAYAQSRLFLQGMADHPELAPVDYLIQNDAFSSGNFQFSAHRALYNNAYGIPQNSLAGIVNAYVAGIRNIEFDVLDTADHVSVLIHDLVTNRLDGTYNGHPNFIEDQQFVNVEGTAIDILIPTGNTAAVEPTGVRLTTTERVLEVVHELMPEMTLYLDARNDAPLSIIRLLYNHPEYRDQVVLKIYPFSLNGGWTDIVTRYADRYHAGNQHTAIQEISAVRPHVLLALGHVEMEANQDVALNWTLDFDWRAFEAVTGGLPFSRDSVHDFRTLDGDAIFTDEELAEIEMRTFLSFHWAMGQTGITNTLVFQMGALPSMVGIIRRNDLVEYGLMSADPTKKYKISAAVHDNFIALYALIKTGALRPRIAVPGIGTVDLSDRIAHVKFGVSDRFPDFAIARRVDELSDQVDPVGMQNFNYSMLGTAGPNQGYQAEKVRSTAAIISRINELETLTDTPVVYATTDLSTDLRMAFMGLFGTNGFPADLKFRASGILKERVANNPDAFVLPTWITRLSGLCHFAFGDDFQTRCKDISGDINGIKKRQAMLRSLELTHDRGLPLTNMDAWGRLGITDVVTEIDDTVYDYLVNDLNTEIATLETSANTKKATFKTSFGVKYIGERELQDYR